MTLLCVEPCRAATGNRTSHGVSIGNENKPDTPGRRQKNYFVKDRHSLHLVFALGRSVLECDRHLRSSSFVACVAGAQAICRREFVRECMESVCARLCSPCGPSSRRIDDAWKSEELGWMG